MTGLTDWALPPLTDGFALLGIALVLCAVGLRLLRSLASRFAPPAAGSRVAALPGWKRAGFSVLLLALLVGWLVTWQLGAAHLPLAAFVRGISSDLSVSLVLLAVMYITRCSWPERLAWLRWPPQELAAGAFAIAAAALVLYPLALGLGNWDLYRLGWAGRSAPLLLALLLLCAFWHFRCGFWRLPVLVAAALIAWSAGLLESANLWDYLLDPWLAVLSLVVSVRCFRRKLRKPDCI